MAISLQPFLSGGANQPLQQQMDPIFTASAPAAEDALMRAQEQSPAYRALHENHLITTEYRITRIGDLDVICGNSTMGKMRVEQALTCHGCCCLVQFFTVSAGCVRKARHSDGRYLLFGEGVHVYHSPFITLMPGGDVPLREPTIVHGPLAIITVQQGFVGLAIDRGQPLLLPPGLHQWNSGTIEFKGLIDLSESIIRLGPYTLVTVDEGYAAVTQDNGQQKILEGGQAYMLTHRNWKFEKFITKKLQTNDVGPITVTTGDNVPLEALATVNWRIDDVQLAARMSANTMHSTNVPAPQDTGATQFDISKLRSDVLRQVTASLAAFVGSVSYSAHGHAVMAAQISGTNGQGEPEPEEKEGAKALFDRQKLIGSVAHANEICSQYGVKILSINLISAYPADRQLLEALSQGAVATVAAEQTETAARGEAQALLTRARAEAEADRIRAEGHAKAEEIKAEGSLKAAKNLESSDVAVTLAKLRTSGECLGEGRANSFFFGLGGPAEIPTGVLGSALMAESASRDR